MAFALSLCLFASTSSQQHFRNIIIDPETSRDILVPSGEDSYVTIQIRDVKHFFDTQYLTTISNVSNTDLLYEIKTTFRCQSGAGNFNDPCPLLKGFDGYKFPPGTAFFNSTADDGWGRCVLINEVRHCAAIIPLKPINPVDVVSVVNSFCRVNFTLISKVGKVERMVTLGSGFELAGATLRFVGQCPALPTVMFRSGKEFYIDSGHDAREVLLVHPIQFVDGEWRAIATNFRASYSDRRWVVTTSYNRLLPYYTETITNLRQVQVTPLILEITSPVDLSGARQNAIVKQCGNFQFDDEDVSFVHYTGLAETGWLVQGPKRTCILKYSDADGTIYQGVLKNGKLFIPYTPSFCISTSCYYDSVQRPKYTVDSQYHGKYLDDEKSSLNQAGEKAASVLTKVGGYVADVVEDVEYAATHGFVWMEKWGFTALAVYVFLMLPGRTSVPRVGILVVALAYIQSTYGFRIDNDSTVVIAKTLATTSTIIAPFLFRHFFTIVIFFVEALLTRYCSKNYWMLRGGLYFIGLYRGLDWFTYLLWSTILIYLYLRLEYTEELLMKIECQADEWNVWLKQVSFSSLARNYVNHHSFKFYSYLENKSLDLFSFDLLTALNVREIHKHLKPYIKRKRYPRDQHYKQNVRNMNSSIFYPREYAYLKNTLKLLSEDEIRVFYDTKITIAMRREFSLAWVKSLPWKSKQAIELLCIIDHITSD